MTPVLVIEVLDRFGRVQERVRAEAFPVTIGRATANTVIVDDRFVSPAHARIEVADDGTLVVEDLQSLNGTYLLEPARAVRRAAVGPDGRVRVGQTVLRLRSPAQAVAPAVPHVEGLALFATRWRLVGVLSASVAFVAVLEYLATYRDLTALKVAAGFMPLLVLLLAWAGTWAIANRIVAQRFQLLAHCAAAALIGALYVLLGEVIDYYAFAFAADRSVSVLQWCTGAVVLTLALHTHSRLCSGEPARRLLLRSVLAGGGVVGLLAFAIYAADRDEHFLLRFPNQLKPPAFRVVSGRSVDRFLDDAQALKETVDQLAQKARAEDPEAMPAASD